jgi:hypothetical protein
MAAIPPVALIIWTKSPAFVDLLQTFLFNVIISA